MSTIRPISICVFLSENKILATEGVDEITKIKYYRPIGGGIEFGETSQEALVREIKEELNAEIQPKKLLGTIENIFTYQGQPGHEIVHVYDAEFIDHKFYSMKKITIIDEDNSHAVWLDINDLLNDKITVYPLGLPKLISGENK